MNTTYDDFQAFVLWRFRQGERIEEGPLEQKYGQYYAQHWLLCMMDEGLLRMEGFRYFRVWP